MTNEATSGQSSGAGTRGWAVAGGVVFALVVVPTVVFAETTFDLLSTAGLGTTGFALVVMFPGIALGALSLLVMLGS